MAMLSWMLCPMHSICPVPRQRDRGRLMRGLREQGVPKALIPKLRMERQQLADAAPVYFSSASSSSSLSPCSYSCPCSFSLFVSSAAAHCSVPACALTSSLLDQQALQSPAVDPASGN
eukprot:3040137-Rhodomonas_salina.1